PVGKRRVELLLVIPAVLDRARELHRIHAVAHADSGRLAIGLGAGLRIAQRAELRAGPDVPALLLHEVDPGGVREAGQRPGVLVALLDVDAGAVGEPSLHARDQVAPAGIQAVVRPLVFERIVQVQTGLLGDQETGADPGAGPEVSVGHLRVELEALRRAIGAARAD